MSHNALLFASRAHGLGHLDQAEGLFRSIPAGTPEFADAVTGLAVIAYQKGQPREAAVHFSRLVALRPGEAPNHCNLGECLRECGRLDEAATQLKIGIALDPDQPDAFNSLGLIHHAQRRMDLAEEALNTALSLRPDFPMAMINLGMVLQERRKLKDAERWFRSALAIDPDNAMGNSNLGQILVEIGRADDLDEAERCCLKAVSLTPHRPQPINNLGNVYRSMGRFEDAVGCYRKAITLAPGMAMPVNNLAQAFQGRARYDEAAELYLNALELEPNSARFHANYASLLAEQERQDEAIARYGHALTIDPSHAESLCGMGQAYAQLQDPDRAVECFRKALDLDPDLTAPRLGLSNVYSELGEFEKAREESSRALASHPQLVEVYYQRASHDKGTVSDEDLQRMVGLLDTKHLGEGARAQLDFALGMVYDHRKDYESAARHFRSGNAHQHEMRSRRGESYDSDSFARWVDEIIAAFTPEQIQRRSTISPRSRRPIFVVGLPRSGTTLTEQILASHSAIHGAGECLFMNNLLKALPSKGREDGSSPLSGLNSLTTSHLNEIAENYLDLIAKRNPDAPYVVDKMPDNVNLLGWIHVLFPHARVIHCRRDLRDVALSCWQTCFGSIRWANDWVSIARRFSDYLRVDEHWKRLSPIQWLDLPYESAIKDPETSARRLIDHVGLDWEPDCLRFHETKRQVRTASLSQVREPIYRTSVARWRNYEFAMQPFLDEMERRGHHLDPQ